MKKPQNLHGVATVIFFYVLTLRDAWRGFLKIAASQRRASIAWMVKLLFLGHYLTWAVWASKSFQAMIQSSFSLIQFEGQLTPPRKHHAGQGGHPELLLSLPVHHRTETHDNAVGHGMVGFCATGGTLLLLNWVLVRLWVQLLPVRGHAGVELLAFKDIQRREVGGAA